ncbi:MAG: hypothetical protein GEU74_12110 [Nitriliruptorales bacterium]|nr:hypothetical protein [Nitriliruptorales bacterium]
MTSAQWELPEDRLEAQTGTFIDACREASYHLVYFLLNVGDGDTQVILLPERQPPDDDSERIPDRSQQRRVIVVDVATTAKVPALLDALVAAKLIDPDVNELFPLVIGTHPHSDHLGGMPQFLRMYGDQVGQFWEPGYYHPSGGFVESMVALEDHPRIRHLQPTSGTTCFIDSTKVSVLTPGIGLRSRFDTYGVAINDASLTLRVEFPTTRIARGKDDDGTSENRVYLKLDAPWSLLLGGDAQTTAWAQAAVDFPELHRDHNPGVYRILREAVGQDQLRAHILKVPHHASKRGINLELVERIRPRLTLISSVAGGGRYNFPHPVSVESIREALKPIGTQTSATRPDDDELGIYYTGGLAKSGGRLEPAGSIAVLVPPKRGERLRVWRFGDGPKDRVDLDRARRIVRLH